MIFGTPGKKDPKKKKKDKDLFGDPLETPKEKKVRSYHKNYMAEQRRRERDVAIDWTKCNKRRRASYKWNPVGFCRHYFPEIFYNPFTTDQKEIAGSIKSRILYGGRQAIAAERGGGKSTITKIVGGVWGIVYGHIDFIVILRANGDEAVGTIADIKRIYETSERLRDDFPEICDPIRAIERAAQKAKTQTVDGEFTFLSWSKTEIEFPTVAGSPASGAIIICKGINSSIRGAVRLEKRPNLVIMDDIETEDTAASVVETASRKRTVERDVSGLSGPGESMAMVFLCTILNRRCLAFNYTDQKKYPQWNGIRQRWIKKFPTRRDLWDRYIEMRRDNFADGDQFGRQAQLYYETHRKLMDAGSIVSNRNRYETSTLPDDTQKELSSLQAAFNKVADGGDWDNFNTEYQNDPPDEETYETLGLTPRLVRQKISGVERGHVPNWVEYITAGIDIGLKTLHWTVAGWGRGMIGTVIDYGTDPIYTPDGDLDDKEIQQGIVDAVLTALLNWRDMAAEKGWPNADAPNTRRTLDKCCVDSGYLPTPVYLFSRADPVKKYVAVKGFGTAQRSQFRPSEKRKIRRGFHWFGSYLRAGKCTLYNVDSDYWKQFIQTGFMLPTKQPGSLHLFGNDKLVHATYSKQICAEEWVREFKTGKGFVEGYRQVHRHNHYLDATAYAAAAASMAGAKPVTVDATAGQPAAPGKQKISLKEKQKAMRARA
jgi:hypothetical protein